MVHLPPAVTRIRAPSSTFGASLAACTALSESNGESHLKRTSSSPYLAWISREEILNYVQVLIYATFLTV